MSRARCAAFAVWVYPHSWELADEAYPAVLRNFDRFERESEIPVFQPWRLLSRGDWTGLFMPLDHLGPDGTAMVADALAEWLRGRRLLDPGQCPEAPR